MKIRAFFLFLGAMLLGQTIHAQAPDAFKYQAVIRDANGSPLTQQAISFRATIHQGSATGPVVFQEPQDSLMTNDFGLVSIDIGVINDLGVVDWSDGPFFLETEIATNVGGPYVISGTSPLLSVPFALEAQNADTSDYAKRIEIQDYAVFQEQRPIGTSGGTFVTGQWVTRDLNTTVSLNGNSIQRQNSTITLSPGVYEVRASAPAYHANRHKVRLQDITNSQTLLTGESSHNSPSFDVQTRSSLEGIFSISVNTDIQLQHRGNSSAGNQFGLGVESNFAGHPEVYATMFIRKLD